LNRRKFIGLSSSAAALAATQTHPAIAMGAPAAGSQPNFIFMIADDLMFRTIRSINNPEVSTPNIDRLVAKGTHFTHCFHQGSWTGAICVASRTMLNTGLSAFKASKIEMRDQSNNTIPCWGQTLREAGYGTFITGKWHLDAVTLSRSFAEQESVGPGYLASTPDMYDRPAPGNSWDPANKALLGHWQKRGIWKNNKADQSIEHSSVIYADAAVEHIAKASKRPSPFFMYVGFNAPHDPRQSPQEFLDMYPADKIAVPPNYLPEHPFDQGEHKTRDELLAPFPRTQQDVQVHRREYYAIISHMDAQIGRILDALQASGRADNTYVILTADHGLSVGEHGLMGKQNQYECSMRIPLIMAGPGIKAGKRIDEMIYQHSMYATTCDLAGVPIPEHVEFPSLVPMLHADNPQAINEEMFGWLNLLQRSIRTKRHKLIFYAPIKRYQVFDLENDPWEMHDLVDDPAYAQVKGDLILRLKAKQKELGDFMDIDHTQKVASNYDG
jgi:arylsulfatase A-like enzyme